MRSSKTSRHNLFDRLAVVAGGSGLVLTTFKDYIMNRLIQGQAVSSGADGGSTTWKRLWDNRYRDIQAEVGRKVQ